MDPGSLADVVVLRGDLLRITGRVGLHDGLLELRPRQASDIVLQQRGGPLPEPLSYPDLATLRAADPLPVGSLVEVQGLTLDDPVVWPGLDTKAKGVMLSDGAGAGSLATDIYPGSGIPGSPVPPGPLRLRGLLRVASSGLVLLPRSLADINPVTERLDAPFEVTRHAANELRWPAPLADVEAFLFEGRTAVLLADVIRAAAPPEHWALRYKVVARDGRQPHEALEFLRMKQGMLVAGVDGAGGALPGVVDSLFVASLGLSRIYFLSDVGELRSYVEVERGPREGTGPCAEGFNLKVEGEQFFLPMAEMTPELVTLDGAEVEALPVAALLPDAVLERYGFDGSFSPAQQRVLYDLRLGPEDGPGEVLTAEQAANAWLGVDDRSVAYGADLPVGPEVAGVCQVEALRRMRLVRRGEGDEVQTVTLRLEDLPSHEITTPHGEQMPAYDFRDMVLASGLLAQGEGPSDFDYSMLASDLLDRPEWAVRFPWGHGHLEKLRYVPPLLRTLSLDSEADLQDEGGTTPYGGLQGHGGWSSIKVLYEIELLPSPDPDHTVDGPDGPYTDPASCSGCHVKRETVEIPVRCEQCHPR